MTTTKIEEAPADRLAAARAAAAAIHHEARADWLRERGYVCLPPSRIISRERVLVAVPDGIVPADVVTARLDDAPPTERRP